MYNCPNTAQVQCIPSADECGVRVVVSSDVAITRVCNDIAYTVTITNNSDQVLKNVVLTLPLDKALALIPNSVEVNGEAVEANCLDQVCVGDIAVGETATITYRTTIMICQRYIKAQARVNFLVCCCFMKKRLCVTSNTNVVQACCCCNCANNNA